jgi:hypothetical protein
MDKELPTDRTLESKVKAWLAKHGYSLEVRVAREFLAAHPLQDFFGFKEGVLQSQVYLDDETGKLREVDVVANWWNPVRRETSTSGAQRRGARWLGIAVVVECKRSSQPWIALTSGQAPRDRWPDAILRSLPQETYEDSFLPFEIEERAKTAPLLNWERPLAHSVVSMSDSDSRRSQPYDAIRQVISGAHGVIQETGGPGDITVQPWVHLVVPVIVTDAPLFECWVDQENAIQVRHVPVTVWSSRLSKESPFTTTSVFLVHEEGVARFAADCHAMAETLWGFPSGSGVTDYMDEDDQLDEDGQP